jgi:hypothetical protein
MVKGGRAGKISYLLCNQFLISSYSGVDMAGRMKAPLTFGLINFTKFDLQRAKRENVCREQIAVSQAQKLPDNSVC